MFTGRQLPRVDGSGQPIWNTAVGEAARPRVDARTNRLRGPRDSLCVARGDRTLAVCRGPCRDHVKSRRVAAESGVTAPLGHACFPSLGEFLVALLRRCTKQRLASQTRLLTDRRIETGGLAPAEIPLLLSTSCGGLVNEEPIGTRSGHEDARGFVEGLPPPSERRAGRQTQQAETEGRP